MRDESIRRMLQRPGAAALHPSERHAGPRLAAALLSIGVGCGFACSRRPQQDGSSLPGISPLDDRTAPLGVALFTDVTAAAGIEFVHENGARGRRFMPETVVGGAGWIDYDGDAQFDLYLVNGNLHPDRGGPGGPDEPTNRLYRNFGGGRFEDVTIAAGVGDRGYGCSLAVGDIDNDGRDDLYVTNFGSNVLYRNAGGGRFDDTTRAAGVEGGGWSTSASFFDYDLDGLLDLYVCRYVAYDPAVECVQNGLPSYCSPQRFAGVPDLLFHNRGAGVFEDVSRAAGVAIAGPSEGKSLGVVILDGDEDGDPDIFVACDQVPNLYFRNDGGGKFTEAGLLTNVAYSNEGLARAGMGIDAGDVDLDGRLDVVITNFADEPNSLFRAAGAGYFVEESKRFELAGLTLEKLGFGVAFIDFDLDSDLDIYVANGHVQDSIALQRPGASYAQESQLLENDAGRRFVDASRRAGEWFRRKTVSRAAALCDFDNDGDDDLAVLCCGAAAVLLRNDTRGGHWIAFQLEGTRSNRDGYGARVAVHARAADRGEFRRTFEAKSARGYASAFDPRVRCGLGSGAVEVTRVEILWPSGRRQELTSPQIDRVHRVVEPAGEGGR